MGGNIGLPILAQDPLPEGGVYVLELSSYQLDLTQSLDCDVAVLLNITPDHLDRYESFEAYAVKMAAVSRCKASDFTSRSSTEHGGNDPTRIVEAGIDLMSILRWSTLYTCLIRQRNGPPYRDHTTHKMSHPRRFLQALGIGDDQTRKAYAPIPASPTASSVSAKRTASLFVNDSKATNPTATAPALAAFEKIRWISAGRRRPTISKQYVTESSAAAGAGTYCWPPSFGGPSPRRRWIVPCWVPGGTRMRLVALRSRHLDRGALDRLGDRDRHLHLEVVAAVA